MRKKVFGLALSAMLFALSLSAKAQQPAKMPRVGYFAAGGDPKTPSPQTEAFRQRLRDFDCVEGKNILVEFRFADGKLD